MDILTNDAMQRLIFNEFKTQIFITKKEIVGKIADPEKEIERYIKHLPIAAKTLHSLFEKNILYKKGGSPNERYYLYKSNTFNNKIERVIITSFYNEKFITKKEVAKCLADPENERRKYLDLLPKVHKTLVDYCDKGILYKKGSSPNERYYLLKK